MRSSQRRARCRRTSGARSCGVTIRPSSQSCSTRCDATLRPEELDASRALAAGVTREALREAAYVAAAFNVITRFADAIGAKPHSESGLTREQAIAHEGRFFESGYA
jgi:hypothetical protein